MMMTREGMQRQVSCPQYIDQLGVGATFHVGEMSMLERIVTGRFWSSSCRGGRTGHISSKGSEPPVVHIKSPSRNSYSSSFGTVLALSPS